MQQVQSSVLPFTTNVNSPKIEKTTKKNTHRYEYLETSFEIFWSYAYKKRNWKYTFVVHRQQRVLIDSRPTSGNQMIYIAHNVLMSLQTTL